MDKNPKPPNHPVDARVRLEIANWDEASAPRGSVSAFCAANGISRKSFYKIRRTAKIEGQAAALAPKSRRPHSSPQRVDADVEELALETRAALEGSGLDCGPISVFDKMKALGWDPPSTATLSRLFRREGAARREPKKKPRTAFRRFVYPAPNACWQLDALHYPLARGRKAVIFQLEDDHSRLEIASLVTTSESAPAAVRVFKKGVRKHGVPQRLLTDNGSALNTSRSGYPGKLAEYATSLGVECITGRPYHPTTQGKNERLHQSLIQFLNARPLCDTIAELQALVDEFDAYYNHTRGHQGLPNRMTPAQAYSASTPARPPLPPRTPKAQRPPTPHLRSRSGADSKTGEQTRRLDSVGTLSLYKTRYNVGKRFAGSTVIIVWDTKMLTVFDEQGLHLITYQRADSNTPYVKKTHALLDDTTDPTSTPTGEVSPKS